MQVVHIVTALWWFAGSFSCLHENYRRGRKSVLFFFFFSPRRLPEPNVHFSEHVTSACRCAQQKRYANLPMLTPEFKQNWKLSTVFSRSSSARFRKSPGCSSRFVTLERADRQTWWMQLIGALRNPPAVKSISVVFTALIKG